MRLLTRVSRNIVANYIGNISVAALSVAFIPLYIRYLGIGGYGLIGFFVTLQGVFSLLDLGLSVTINRQLASLAGNLDSQQEMSDLLRTLETIYWATAFLIGVVVVATAPLIATRWLHASGGDSPALVRVIALMGVSIALQWPFALYSGGLQGLQRQIPLNALNVATALVRGVGAVLILRFFVRSLAAYFAWQIVVALLQTALAAACLWAILPATPRRATFRPTLLRNISRFAAGVVGIGVLSTLVSQVDKVLLSRILSLSAFGYYTLAGVAAASLYRLIGPVFSAVFPALTEAAGKADATRASALYHRSAQLVSVTTIPAAAVGIGFARELMLLWTGSALTADNVTPVFRLLLAGTAVNGLLNVPYALQLASGWTSFTLTANVCAVVILGPAIALAASRYGGIGAAAVWLALNCGYFITATIVMFRRLLRTERWRWLFVDIAGPLLASASVVAVARVLWISTTAVMTQIVMLIVVSAIALASAVVAAPDVRLGAVRFVDAMGGPK
jgi:O-antigen/teichoic acid export membrane protein